MKSKEFDTIRAELIRLKVDARSISLHEWLDRAYALLNRIEKEAVTKDRLSRVIGPGKVVEHRGDGD